MLRTLTTLGLALALAGCVRREAHLGSRCPEGVEHCAEAPASGPWLAPSPVVDGGTFPSPVDAACDGDCGAARDGSRKRSRCVPGHYAGDYYVPEYHPNASGLCGLTTLYGGSGLGAWEFVIPPGGADASTMEVQTCLDIELLQDSQQTGSPAPSALRTSMTATLDCETGELRGEIRGAYYSTGVCDLGTVQSWYPVKGFLDAVFDPELQAFENGVVDVHEPPTLLPLGSPPPGGAGSWRARLTVGASDAPPVSDCLQGVEYTDFEVFP